MAGQETSPSSTSPAKQIPSARESPRESATNPKLSIKQMSSVNITSRFTQSQLALALTIQKSKPRNLSTSEYCQQLRTHIKLGRNIRAEDHRYVDTCEFWKDHYTQIHLEKEALEDKLHFLEEKQRLLQQKPPSDDSQSPDQRKNHAEQISGKSNANGGIVTGVSRKHAAAKDIEGGIEDQQADGMHLPSPAEDSLLRLSRYILRIGRQRTNLERASQAANNVAEIDELAKSSSQILLLLDNALHDCCIPLCLLKTNDEHKQTLAIFQQVMNQIGISFLSCFRALDELCRTILGRNKKATLVYQMVMFFNKALNLLHTISTLQVESEAVDDNRRPRHKRPRVEEGEYAVNKYLAKTLAATVYALEWKVHQPGHSDLLEGMLFSVLEHTGRLVSEAIFAEHVAISKNPGNITEANEVPVRNGAAKFESRYVVQVLHAALGGSNKKELVAQVLATGKTNVDVQTRFGGSTGLSTLKGELLTKAKALIQSTLLKSVVGGAEPETLKLPPAPTEDEAMLAGESPGSDIYGSDWLVETVWALIGWDLVV